MTSASSSTQTLKVPVMCHPAVSLTQNNYLTMNHSGYAGRLMAHVTGLWYRAIFSEILSNIVMLGLFLKLHYTIAILLIPLVSGHHERTFVKCNCIIACNYTATYVNQLD